MTARRRTRRTASGRELAAAVVVILVMTAVGLWIARIPVAPVWLAAGGGFVAGVASVLSWQRWVARTAHRLGYVKIRGRL